MADLHSLSERFFYTNRRTYSVKEGEIAYLDASPLRRPFSMPAAQRVILIVILVIAAVLGAIFVNDTVLAAVRHEAESEQRVADNLARQASIETIPAMAQMINRDDEGIRAAFNEAGYSVFDASDLAEGDELVLYKIPSDVSLDEVAVLYAQGINSLNIEQATRLLNGSWYFSADRSEGTSMVVRYADFTTGDPQIAVQSALAKEGFDPASATENGEDEAGNTFIQGTLDADGTACRWRISALPLTDVYSIPGLPENACYVGVRISA